MNRILIKDALKAGNIYQISNQYDIKNKYDRNYAIRSRIKIIDFEEFKLKKKDMVDTNNIEFLESKICRLSLEYTNLNFIETSFVTDNLYISNTEGSIFYEIQEQDIMQAIANHLGKSLWSVLEDRNRTLIPKIKVKIEIFYMLPDKETEYYLEAENCEIEEL